MSIVVTQGMCAESSYLFYITVAEGGHRSLDPQVPNYCANTFRIHHSLYSAGLCASKEPEIHRLVMDCKHKNVISSTLNGLLFHFTECLLASEMQTPERSST